MFDALDSLRLTLLRLYENLFSSIYFRFQLFSYASHNLKSICYLHPTPQSNFRCYHPSAQVASRNIFYSFYCMHYFMAFITYLSFIQGLSIWLTSFLCLFSIRSRLLSATYHSSRLCCRTLSFWYFVAVCTFSMYPTRCRPCFVQLLCSERLFPNTMMYLFVVTERYP